MTRAADTIDVADIVLALRRGWRAIAAYTAIGIAGAVAVMLLAPKRYDGTSTIVVRTAEPLSLLSRMGGGAVGGAIGSDAASALMGSRSVIETELQILESRSVAQSVIDSLGLQVRVRAPHGIPPLALLQEVDLPGSFRRVSVEFEFARDGRVHVRGGGIDTTVAAGAAIPVRGGRIAFRPDAHVDGGQLDLLDLEDATNLFNTRLSVAKAGGEVVRVSYRADDSLTAAMVPNVVIGTYLARRKTTDRGVNEHRVEFLAAQLDSTGRELSGAERALRRFQESSGMLSADVMGRVQLERGAELRKQLTEAQVEEGAITQLIGQVEKGTISARELAAYPAFLRSTGLSDMLSQLSTLDAQRLKLLERRTEKDPEVQAIAQSMASIQGQFLPMARTYANALTRERRDLDSQLDSLRAELGVLPGAAESGNRLQRDVLRLGQIFAAMQAQMVEARLTAIAEGGDVRQLDIASAPKKPAFPRPGATIALGSAAGLLTGVVAALVLAVFGRWARDAAEIERTTGVPTLRFDRRAPLIVTNDTARAVLVIPLAANADALGVAKQIVETALSRASTATLLDLSVDTATGARSSLDVSGTIERLTGEFGTVVVSLPSMESDATLAALNSRRTVVFVVPSGRVDRGQLTDAMQTLRRLDVPCAGIVVSGGPAERLPRGGHALVS